MERYYTVKEVCGILHRNNKTVYNYIKSGMLKASKPGNRDYLISESDLNDFIAAGIKPGYFQEMYPRPHKGDAEPSEE